MSDAETLDDVKDWEKDIALLDAILTNRDNYDSAGIESSEENTYKLHFSFKYLWNRTVEKLNEFGFEIHSFSTDSHKADFQVRVRRVRPARVDELDRINSDHYLMPDDLEMPKPYGPAIGQVKGYPVE